MVPNLILAYSGRGFIPLVPILWAIICFGLGWINARCTLNPLSLSLFNWTGERKYDERLEGQDKDRKISLTNYCHGQNRLNLGRKGSLTHHQSN